MELQITRLKDTAPGGVRLDMTCDDCNLAAFLKEPEEKIFDEVVLLKKIDPEKVIVRKTVNGKFKDPEFRASYCPANAQRPILRVKHRAKRRPSKKPP
jgi:hypothetical protein